MEEQGYFMGRILSESQAPIYTTETVEEYRKMTKKQQDDTKDVGGYVGGHLKGVRRKSGTVLCRSMLTLDMDYGTEGIAEELEMLFGYKMCIYSTHKHTANGAETAYHYPAFKGNQ